MKDLKLKKTYIHAKINSCKHSKTSAKYKITDHTLMKDIKNWINKRGYSNGYLYTETTLLSVGILFVNS